MLFVFLLSFLPPVASAIVMIPTALLVIARSREDLSSRPRGLQLFLASSAVFGVWTVAAPFLLVVVLVLALTGGPVLEGVLGFAVYALFGVSMQLWPDAYVSLAFLLRTKSFTALLEQPGSLTYARPALKVLGAYAQFIGLILLARWVLGFGTQV